MEYRVIIDAQSPSGAMHASGPTFQIGYIPHPLLRCSAIDLSHTAFLKATLMFPGEGDDIVHSIWLPYPHVLAVLEVGLPDKLGPGFGPPQIQQILPLGQTGPMLPGE